MPEASYLSLFRSGELKRRAEVARTHEAACDLCARSCGINRAERTGACHTGLRARVASYGPHHGEEDPLRGWNGSGTIFFSWCNLRCVYCQNHDISQAPAGHEMTSAELAAIMIELQARGCHNINLVSPSHVVAEILDALVLAVKAGLTLPLVYNTGGYDSLATLELLDGVIDLYMPDMKYSQASVARGYSKIKDYPRINQKAVREMHRQVGDLQLDPDGIAIRGLLVRHLVLPARLAGTRQIMRFLATEISTDTYVNIMQQYRPAFQAGAHPLLNRRPTQQKFDEAYRWARQAGLHRFDRS
ncbi:MAG: radical SAM protein [Anaerolineales bacterium]